MNLVKNPEPGMMVPLYFDRDLVGYGILLERLPQRRFLVPLPYGKVTERSINYEKQLWSVQLVPKDHIEELSAPIICSRYIAVQIRKRGVIPHQRNSSHIDDCN